MILTGQDTLAPVARYVAGAVEDMAVPEPGMYWAFGVMRNRRIIGGVVLSNFRRMSDGADIEIAVAGEPGWLTKELIRTTFGYTFRQLGCTRVTCLTRRKNHRSRRLLDRLGFRLEGVARNAFGVKRDAMIYGMIRSECRWI